MGAWGAGLFQDDDAADLRDEWLDEYKRTGSAAEASAAVRKAFKSGFKDSDEGPVLTLALATMLWRHGVLDAKTRAEALAVIDKEKGLDRWRDEGEKVLRGRLKVYAKIRAGLLEKQPPVKTYKKKPVPKPDHPDLAFGDIFSVAAPEGGVAYYRVVGRSKTKYGDQVSVQLLDIKPGTEVDVTKLGSVPGVQMRSHGNYWFTRLEILGWRTRGVNRKGVVKLAGFSRESSKAMARKAGPRPTLVGHYSWEQLPHLARVSFDKLKWKNEEEMEEFYRSLSAAEIRARSVEIETLLRRMMHDRWSVCVPPNRLRKYHGEFEKAEAVYDIAVRMFPTDYLPWTWLGSARWHQGNQSGAEEAWAKARAVGGPDKLKVIEEDIAKTRAGLDLQPEKKSP